MSNSIQDFLQVSAKLYKHLSNVPTGDERSKYIEIIESFLDERGKIVDKLKKEGFRFEAQNQAHLTLFELDKGINERLEIVFSAVKDDIKDLYNAKRNEIHYIDPYDKLRNLDGRYFDGKK